MNNREEIIRNYISAYNAFDIERMTKDLDDNILFENRADGETTLSLLGIEAFKTQAETARGYFTSRRQTVKGFRHSDDETEVEIDYFAVLAQDFPTGLKKGSELNLQGRSVFHFSGDKITKLTDIS